MIIFIQERFERFKAEAREAAEAMRKQMVDLSEQNKLMTDTLTKLSEKLLDETAE